MPTNPVSVPGGWNKDTPAAEKSNPIEDTVESVPRSATGVVSEAGDIVDEDGKSVGKIPDSQDSGELVGNTVNESGEVLSSAGDVVGKANIGEGAEYTTDNTDDTKSSGWFGKTKGIFSAAGNVGKGIGSLGGSQKGEQVDDAKDTPTTDNVNDTVDTKNAEEATEKADDKAQVDTKDAEETAEETAEKADDKAQVDTKDAEETAENADDKAQVDTKDAEETAENADDKAQVDAQDSPVQLEDREETETTDKAEEQVKDATDQPEDVKDAADNAGDEIKDGTEKPEEAAEDVADPEKATEEQPEDAEQVDYSVLEGAKVNKVGNLVDKNGSVVGRLAEGDPKQLQGKTSDANGDIWNDAGKIVGKGEPIPDAEKDTAKDFAPFENFPDAIVEADGRVTSNGQQVGTVIEGDPKRLKGSKVDEDGDILDRNGNTVGKAEAWDEPEALEEEKPDCSILAGKRVNKAGNVVDQSGAIFGRVVEGNVSSMIGRMCDKDGNVRSESGDVVGRAEVIPEGEREGAKEGPFAELEGCTVSKDGKVVTASGDVVGRLTSGDPKTLFGRPVDEDGDVVDRNGNVLGKAERWEEPEVEKKKGPMAGRKVNREGNVVDEDGNIIGKLVNGDLTTCSGKEIDDDGDVINSKGNSVGHVALLEDIPPEAESAEEKGEREQAEKDKKLAQQLAGSIEQSLEKIRPILKMITDKIDKAERTPKEELDEEQLVKEVKPLIEEGNKILTEANGMIRGMDPDGRIQRNAKHKSSTKDASPEEHHLAEVLKELTGTVTETVDNAKRKIEDMPHAKKELNPLWGLLTEPLGQILAAVGLLLNGVLGLVGRLLSGLGLGGLVDGLLGGLGLDKILGSLGLGSAYDSLTGKDQKKK